MQRRNSVSLHAVRLPVELSLPATLLALAHRYATEHNRPDLAQRCQDVAQKVPGTKVSLLFNAADVMAGAHDSARAHNEPEVLALLTELCRDLKEGQSYKVLAGIQYNMKSLGQLDDVLEDIRVSAQRQAEK